jgi:hypothetical protein
MEFVYGAQDLPRDGRRMANVHGISCSAAGGAATAAILERQAA